MSKQDKFAARVKTINKLRRQGMGYRQQAEATGVTVDAIKSFSTHAVHKGYKLDPIPVRYEDPIPIPPGSRVPHGGGATGVKHCRCELCRKRRAAYSKAYKHGSPRPNEDYHYPKGGFRPNQQLSFGQPPGPDDPPRAHRDYAKALKRITEFDQMWAAGLRAEQIGAAWGIKGSGAMAWLRFGRIRWGLIPEYRRLQMEQDVASIAQPG